MRIEFFRLPLAFFYNQVEGLVKSDYVSNDDAEEEGETRTNEVTSIKIYKKVGLQKQQI